MLAIAVVTRDRTSLFARSLVPSLRAAPLDEVDVLVVDQSLDERTADLVRELPHVRYIRGGPGLSRGRNAAVAATSAPLIAFTDDDVRFPSEWPKDIIAAFDGVPDAGAVCGRARLPDGEVLFGRSPGVYRWPTIPFALGSGFNIAFRREALEAAGPFDEELGAGAPYRSAEDSDMLYRVMRSGWAVVCSDDITVVHDDWRSPEDLLRLHRDYGFGAGAQTMKHTLSGDRTALGLAGIEIGRHLVTLARSVLRLRRLIAALQLAWLWGFVLGCTRRITSARARTPMCSPATRPE